MSNVAGRPPIPIIDALMLVLETRRDAAVDAGLAVEMVDRRDDGSVAALNSERA
jgi:hypothetical protein